MAPPKKSKRKKGPREKIRLVHKETGHFYTTTINKRNKLAKKGSAAGKLILRKFNPVTRKHEDYIEGKIK